MCDATLHYPTFLLFPFFDAHANSSDCFRRLGARSPFFHRRSWLATDTCAPAFARPCIGLGSLSADRKAFAMTQSSVAPRVNQPLDIQRDLFAQVSFDPVI